MLEELLENVYRAQTTDQKVLSGGRLLKQLKLSLEVGNWSEVSSLLSVAELDKLDTKLLANILAETAPCKATLSAWDSFVAKCESLLEDRVGASATRVILTPVRVRN